MATLQPKHSCERPARGSIYCSVSDSAFDDLAIESHPDSTGRVDSVARDDGLRYNIERKHYQRQYKMRSERLPVKVILDLHAQRTGKGAGASWVKMALRSSDIVRRVDEEG